MGLDLAEEELQLKRASSLAPPPAGILPDPARPLKSGLDAVISLSLADPEVAVKRGAGRRVDPATGCVYHLEWNPPPAADPGLVERLVEDIGDSNDAVQLERRVLAHQQAHPSLAAWLGRFVTLLHEKPGEDPIDSATDLAIQIVSGGARAKEARAKVDVAAAACKDALAAAEEARAQAEAAHRAAESAAHDLFRAKLAEVQAQEMLHKKGVDVASQELLKAQAAEACAASLRAASDAATQAETAAGRSADALAQAQEAYERCEASLQDTAALAGAHDAALASAKAAKDALDAARKASETAAGMMGSAKAAYDKAQRAAAGEEVEEMKELAAAAAGAGAKGGKGGAAAAGGAGGKGGKAPAATPSAAAAAPGEQHDEPEEPPALPIMSVETARELWAHWQELETRYMKSLEAGLGSLRNARESAASHFIDVRDGFVNFLHAPDGKQELVDDLWTQLRSQGDAVYSDTARNQEWLQRAAELRDRLWEMCDTKMKDAEQRKAQVQASPFVTQESERVTAMFIEVVQVEVTRLFATAAFMQRASKGVLGLPVPTKPFPDAPVIKDGALPGDANAMAKSVQASAMGFDKVS